MVRSLGNFLIGIGALLILSAAAHELDQASPPLKREFMDVTRTETTLTFYFQGEKIRDCELIAVSGGWVFSTGAVIPATLLRADGTAVGAPLNPTPFVRGDTFRSGPFTTRIWTMVNEDFGAELRVVNRYRCHALWDTLVVTSMPLAGTPLTPG